MSSQCFGCMVFIPLKTKELVLGLSLFEANLQYFVDKAVDNS